MHRRSALLAGATVSGVLASTPDRSAEVATSWHTEPFADIEQVAASDADVGHVASPNATHAPYVSTLLAAGKHVVCEKPLGLTVDEATAMTEQAERAGAVATVPFVYRHHGLDTDSIIRAALVLPSSVTSCGVGA